jgi:phytanoyl-CoA hydroxylase
LEIENGGLVFAAGSNEPKIREHKAIKGSRDAHAIETFVKEGEVLEHVTLSRGDVSIHDEWVVHGSGGNYTKDQQRRTWVLAFRTKETREIERANGFTHSHNEGESSNWDNFYPWSAKK